MKNILLKFLMAVTALFLPPSLMAVNTITHTATYDFSNLTTGTDTLGGVAYTTVNYDGLYNGGAPGSPSLPVDYLRFSVPWNATNFTVTATLKNTIMAYVDNLVYPCQEPRLMSDTTPVVITLPDSSAYFSGTKYPAQNAWVVDEGFLAGENHIVTVAVMPVSYRHRKVGFVWRNEISRHQAIQLTLRYDLSDSLAMYPIVRNDSTLRQEGYVLTQSMVVNPSNVAAYAPIDMTMDSLIFINPNQGDGLNGGNLPPFDEIDPDSLIGYGGELQAADYYPYLIVTTSDLEHSVRRIAALKRQKGYNVKVVTMDEVLNSPYSQDGDRIRQSDGTYSIADTSSVGKLRQLLKYYYMSHGTRFVLLVGDAVPYKLKRYISKDIPSDLYLSDLNADWSADTIDRNPEIYVGRLLADNGEQIKNYTEKLFRYELNPGHGNYDYLRRIFYSEGIDFEKESEWDNVNESYSQIFPINTRYLEIINGLFPSGTDIVNEINATKYGYLSFMNHGGPSGLLTYGHRNNVYYPKDTTETTAHYYLWAIDSIHYIYYNIDTLDFHTYNGLNNLDNKWFPSICYSAACTLMPYDKVKGYTRVTTNFGESFTTGRDYGGPAFLGNTREGYLYKNSTSLEKSFAESILSGHNKIGLAEAVSKSVFTTLYPEYTYYIAMVHNLLGDPEFELWTDIPQRYTNISITRSDNTLYISGISPDSTIVAVYNNGGQMRKITVRDANISLNANPNSTIMLYKHNHIPYIAPLELQNMTFSKNQYVIANDVTAGELVDSNRTAGDVVVKSGIEYEIEASGTVTLEDGFMVEKGATFAVYPSSF